MKSHFIVVNIGQYRAICDLQVVIINFNGDDREVRGLLRPNDWQFICVVYEYLMNKVGWITK